MKRYGVGESIPQEEGSESEKDQMKENRTSKKGIATSLMTKGDAQREEVAPRDREKPKRLLENRGEQNKKGQQTLIHPLHPAPL